jgi:acylphosphatase
VVVRAHLTVSGFVQGVSFRLATRERARSRGIAGWVRNRPDGAVEAVFEGPEEAVRSLVDWCRRGPAGAEVESVDVAWEEPQGERGFGVR